MKFGFIAHVNNQKEYNMIKAVNQFRRLSFIGTDENDEFENAVNFVTVRLTSKAGAKVEGRIVYIPWLPQEILDKTAEAMEAIKAAALELEKWGADVIGLGGYTAAIGGRGTAVQEILTHARVTTGNTFTATTSVDILDYILDKAEIDIKSLNTAIIGFPGSISLLIAKMLLIKGATITMVGRRENLVAKKYFSDIPEHYDRISFSTDLDAVLSEADIVFSATTTGHFIDQSLFKSGAIVIDVGEPKDVIGEKSERSDILVVDGGRFSFSDEVDLTDLPVNDMFRSGFFGCIGETVLIALEENTDYCSTGRLLDLKKAGELREIGKKHGFIVDSISQWKENVDDGAIYNIRNILQSRSKTAGYNNVFERLKKCSKDEIMDLYAKYINPVLVAVNQSGNYERLYVHAEGMHVWDSEGKEYLDFVGGYGSVNTGHNHPRILNCIKNYIEAQPPGILQVTPGYFASLLGEKLCSVLPGDINRVFFCNSGTEAVEGSLKLARIYTGRSKYISTRNSFHGKSFGSLSVTGREKYQKFFRPLLSEVIFTDYNSTDDLEELLAGEDIAAMIVEPIQGEGGVIAAKPGYLKKCLELCHKYGTLLIVDEVQTGFGRSGKMFAVEHDGVVPDIIACAKSLGGGIIPIGAYGTKEEIWSKAYGNQSKYLLHTSTFGGNGLCSAVALEAIDVIRDEKLPENAAGMGEYLINGLREISADYSFIKEVRGKGLLIGIEFDYSVSDGISALADLIRSMVPANVKRLYSALSNDISESIKKFFDDSIVNVEKYLSENFASQFSAEMLNDHGIISIVTLNNPMVIRIEPPLIITKKEADIFLNAFRSVCEKNRLLNEEQKNDFDKLL